MTGQIAFAIGCQQRGVKVIRWNISRVVPTQSNPVRADCDLLGIKSWGQRTRLIAQDGHCEGHLTVLQIISGQEFPAITRDEKWKREEGVSASEMFEHSHGYFYHFSSSAKGAS
jgi:hypothetical protein